MWVIHRRWMRGYRTTNVAIGVPNCGLEMIETRSRVCDDRKLNAGMKHCVFNSHHYRIETTAFSTSQHSTRSRLRAL
ncbi:hypothetical protein Moror_5237 [Moniliophthora roreri MCA 2997]|uniref:Uncharacterized protein n=1 Tax=Moniliophthora roreri (strain MCA 2997) TaxID=1381753 RepID=V2X5Y1_MONRO|nr:hypothetical protein Moror_5237 [Moniliophthora roreri MCA 2997]